MLILDTDIVSLLHAGNATILRHVDEIRESEAIVITIVTRVEILRGRIAALLTADNKQRSLAAQRLLLQSEAQLAETPVLFLDDTALDLYTTLRNTPGARNIGRADLLIAAIALARDATLATRNVKHFSRVPMLRLVNWKD